MGRTHLVVDGSNIATEGRTAPSLAQLDEAVRAFLEQQELRADRRHRRRDVRSSHRRERASPASRRRSSPARSSRRRRARSVAATRSSSRWRAKPTPTCCPTTPSRSCTPSTRGCSRPVACGAASRCPRSAGCSSRARRCAASPAARSCRPPRRPRPSRRPPRTTATGRRPTPARRPTKAEPRSTASAGDGGRTPTPDGGRADSRATSADASVEPRGAAAVAVDGGGGGGGGGGGDASKASGRSGRRRSTSSSPTPRSSSSTRSAPRSRGIVDRFSSHGAYVTFGAAIGYVPLKSLGDPPPRSAREILTVGEERDFSRRPLRPDHPGHRRRPHRRRCPHDLSRRLRGAARRRPRQRSPDPLHPTPRRRPCPLCQEDGQEEGRGQEGGRKKKAAARKAPAEEGRRQEGRRPQGCRPGRLRPRRRPRPSGLRPRRRRRQARRRRRRRLRPARRRRPRRRPRPKKAPAKKGDRQEGSGRVGRLARRAAPQAHRLANAATERCRGAPVRRAPLPPIGSPGVRLATWNVNSLGARLERVEAWLAEVEPDVLCLQETKLADDAFPALTFSRARLRVGPPRPGALERRRHPEPGRSRRARRRLRARRRDPARRGAHRLGHVRRRPGRQRLRAQRPVARPRAVRVQARVARRARRRTSTTPATPPTDVVVCGDFNIAPDDRDVYDPAKFVGSTHVTPGRARRAGDSCSTGASSTCSASTTTSDRLYSWWDYRAGDFHQGRGPAHRPRARRPRRSPSGRVWSLVDRNARKGKPTPSDHAPLVVEFADA